MSIAGVPLTIRIGKTPKVVDPVFYEKIASIMESVATCGRIDRFLQCIGCCFAAQAAGQNAVVMLNAALDAMPRCCPPLAEALETCGAARMATGGLEFTTEPDMVQLITSASKVAGSLHALSERVLQLGIPPAFSPGSHWGSGLVPCRKSSGYRSKLAIRALNQMAVQLGRAAPAEAGVLQTITDAQPEVGPPNTDAQPEVCAPMIDAEPESARPLQRKSRRTGLCQKRRRLRAAVNTTIAAKLEVVLYARSLPSASAVEKLCMLKWPDRLKSRQLVHWRAACDKYQWERMTQKDRSVWSEPPDWWKRDVCNLKSEKSKSKMQALFPEPCLEELERQIVAVTMGQSAVTSRAETVSHKEIRQTASHIATCYNDVIAKQIAEKTAARLQVLRDFEEGDGASAGVCTVDLWPSLPPDPWGGCLPPPMC